MSKESTTFGLSSKKIVELLHIGAEEHDYEKNMSEQQEKAELLASRLAEPLMLDPSVTKLLPAIPSLLSGAMDISGGEPIRTLLLNPESTISVLRKVKNYNNKLSRRAESCIERDVAVILYYGAIASALVFHNKRISRFFYKSLERSFSSLIGKTWITTELTTLFAEALKICQSSHKKSKSSDKQLKPS